MKLFAMFSLMFLTASLVNGQPIAVDLQGEALLDHLETNFAPTRTLSYTEARHEMFSDIDNVGGEVELVYTGEFFATTSIPNHNVVNTEHTWPQSKFGSGSQSGAMKTDLHHLYPTYNPVNGARGNSPFADIPDQDTEKWWTSDQAEFGIPNDEIDGYSESTRDQFEPREAHKGNVARSLAYFYTVYRDDGIDVAWFEPQLPTLLEWHDADPVTDQERERSIQIAAVQGNENPYVMDETLMRRALAPGTGPVVDPPPVGNPREELLERIQRLEDEIGEIRLLVEQLPE